MFIALVCHVASSAVLLVDCSLAAAQPPVIPIDLGPVTITSVRGCVDVYPITVSCTFPVTLSITTSNLGTLNPADLFLLVSGVDVDHFYGDLQLGAGTYE